MKLKFSFKVSLIGGILAISMLFLSYWQWQRYLAKELFLAELDSRLEQEVTPFNSLMAEIDENFPDWPKLLHRRTLIKGEWDFEHEMTRRNMRDEADGPGVHVITPFKTIDNNGKELALLVNRGYLPLSVKDKEDRKNFQQSVPNEFVGLVKLSETPRYFLSPADPPVNHDKWIDAWLRVHIEKMQEQIPYPLLPIQLEMISTPEKEAVEAAMVKVSKAREDILFLANTGPRVSSGELNPDKSYPVPAFSAVVPSATHLAYVFEWAFMALLTTLITIVLQLDRGRKGKAIN
jgi:cytochrome oxidase assembly protein ShyY1